MTQLLDPKIDIAFKKVFGTDPIVLISFLNAILPLPEDGLIETLEYMPSEQVPVTPELKNSTVDVKCIDQQKRRFIVEMQMNWTKYFSNRMVFNTSKAYVNQIGLGEKYDLLYPTYGVAIINDVFDKKNPDKWYHAYSICDPNDPKDKLKGFEIVLIEVPKFQAKTYEEKKLRVLWLRFLKEMQGCAVEDVPNEFHTESSMERALELLKETSFNRVELASYEKILDNIRMDHDFRATYKEIGLEEGLEKGMEKGMEKGQLDAKKEIAKKMLRRARPILEIIEDTGLSEIEILELK